MSKQLIVLFVVVCSVLFSPTTTRATGKGITQLAKPVATLSTCEQWVAVSKANNIVYFLLQAPKTIKRFDLATGGWLPSITLDQSTAFTPTMLIVDNSGIYVGSPEMILRLSLDGNNSTQIYSANTAVDLTLYQDHLYLLGEFLPNSSQSIVTAINKLTGALEKVTELFYRMQGGSVLASQNMLFARTVDVGPADIVKAKLELDGSMINQVDSPYHGDFEDAKRTFLFPDGLRVVDDSGTVYSTNDLAYQGSLNGAFKAIEFADNGVFVLRDQRIIKYSADALDDVGQVVLELEAQEIAVSGNTLYYFYTAGSDIGFSSVLLSEFAPLANVAPIASQVFPYTPDVIVTDSTDQSKVVYLLSKSAKTIFRWSTASMSYLPPISLAESPTHIAVSAISNRIYIAYPSGRITYRDLSNPVSDQKFVTLPHPPHRVVAANEILFVTHGTASSSNTHRTYNPTGQLLQSYSGASLSDEFVWNENARALFYTYDTTTPNDVVRETINDSGAIGCCFDSPYHGDYTVYGPVRVKPDASAVILQTGDIYSGSSLLHLGALPNTITDALWISDTLYTLRGNGSQSQIQVWSSGYTQTQTLDIAGKPLRLFNSPQGLLVITLVNATPQFMILSEALQLKYASAPPKRAFLSALLGQIPSLLKPGAYPMANQCDVISIPNSRYFYAQINMCVQSVDVRDDGHMSFNLSWELIYKANGVNSIEKGSDADNPNMNLLDNLGRRYNHIQTTGAAAQSVAFYTIGQTVNGSFVFPPAKFGATAFNFNDNDQNAHICALTLPVR